MKAGSRLVAALSLGAVGAVGCGPPADSLLVEGHIEGWRGGAGYRLVAVPMYKADPVPVLATGVLSESGDFRIRLPSGDALSPYLWRPSFVPPGRNPKSESCPLSPMVSEGLEVASVRLVATDPAAGDVGLSLRSRAVWPGESMPGDVLGAFHYAFQDGSILGRRQCVSYNSKSTTDYLVTYARGWNFYKVEIKEYVDDPLNTVYTAEETTGPLPPQLKWFPG
ncbi:MAG: hypothetical protein U1A78_25485 [Polyangia bacterium]